jgi:hypothetical protein
MSIHRNRLVTAISNTPGTGGALTIAAASPGYRTFAAGDNGLLFDVVIVDGTAWEVRTDCTYTHSGTSLSRGTREDSSTGADVSLTSAAIVTATPSAGKWALVENVLDGALTRVTNNGSTVQTMGTGTTKVNTALTTVEANPYTWWDTTNKKFTPTRAGYYLCYCSAQQGGSSSQIQAQFYKNGATAGGITGAAPTGAYAVSICSGIAHCNGTTDYLEMYLYSSTGGALSAGATNTYVSFLYLSP